MPFMDALNPEITIRRAYADDDLALLRLAALDSADSVPEGPLLVAELDGELRAAMSLSTGAAIADPFTRTADVLELMRLHASAIRRRELRPRRGAWRLLAPAH
jgi:hypothetical protein